MRRLFFIFLLAVRCFALPAPIAGTNVSAGDTGGVGSATTSAVDTTGAVLLACACGGYAGQCTGVSDSRGNTWNVSLTAEIAGSAAARLYVAAVSSAGAGETFTGAGTAVAIACAAFKGTTASSTPDRQNGANGGGISALNTGSITPLQGNELILSALGANDGATQGNTSGTTIDSGFTIISQIAYVAPVHVGVSLAYFVQTLASPINPQWANACSSTCGYAATIASFQSPISVSGQGFVF